MYVTPVSVKFEKRRKNLWIFSAYSCLNEKLQDHGVDGECEDIADVSHLDRHNLWNIFTA